VYWLVANAFISKVVRAVLPCCRACLAVHSFGFGVCILMTMHIMAWLYDMLIAWCVVLLGVVLGVLLLGLLWGHEYEDQYLYSSPLLLIMLYYYQPVLFV